MARAKILKKKADAALKKGRVAEAGKFLEQLCRQDAKDIESWADLAGIRTRQGLFADAIQCYQRVLQQQPGNAAASTGMAGALLGLGRFVDAQKHAEQALRNNPASAEACFALGEVFRQQNKFDAAEKYYSQTVSLDAAHALAHYYRGNMLKTQGRTEEAVASYDAALSADPELVEAFWNRERILPIIVDSEQQIEASRTRYEQGIDNILSSLDLGTPKGRKKARRGLITSTNFYLQYQGCDDLPLQRKYGEMVSQIMAANYPQWSAERTLKPLEPGERIRVGYVSAYLRGHNGAVWLLGWLKNRNRDDFEIYGYHTDNITDDKTTQFAEHCDHFHHIPGDIENLCKQIVRDELHILIYPELGMDPQSMLTAGLRLAPVQCVGWGHPITSGLPTMDYWLSSDLMEPDNGQEHYSEKLVRLPNMANCYSREQHDRLQSNPTQKTRSDFGLPEDAVLYFCSQSLFKYLPQYDYLWPEIAKKVPQARFVFLAISSVHVVKRFMDRVEKAFEQAGLRAQDYCIMLNRQSPNDYLALNQLVDVFLDNPPWSGNNTGLAAIDAHLPIVSWPTGFMRGRHSCAILKMLGVTETIAESGQEYIDIAVKLGADPAYREQVVRKIAEQHARIYDDVQCVEGLEQFYREVVGR